MKTENSFLNELIEALKADGWNVRESVDAPGTLLWSRWLKLGIDYTPKPYEGMAGEWDMVHDHPVFAKELLRIIYEAHDNQDTERLEAIREPSNNQYALCAMELVEAIDNPGPYQPDWDNPTERFAKLVIWAHRVGML